MEMDYKAEYDKTRAMYAEAERRIKSMEDELSDTVQKMETVNWKLSATFLTIQN